MAINDPESSLAEDRALNAFGSTPTDGEVLRALWPAFERAFRKGFRAGQEAGRYPVKAVPEHESAAWALMVVKRLEALERMHEGQPEKTTQWERAIEGRLDSITERANEQHQSIEKLEDYRIGHGQSLVRHSGRIEALEHGTIGPAQLVPELLKRIGVLEACLKSGGCWAHLPFPDADAHMDERQRECFAQMQEAKLRLLEPIG